MRLFLCVKYCYVSEWNEREVILLWSCYGIAVRKESQYGAIKEGRCVSEREIVKLMVVWLDMLNKRVLNENGQNESIGSDPRIVNGQQ